jgi:hypothetical protein
MIRKILALFLIFPILALPGLAQGGPIVLDDGTPLRLRTTRSLSSADAHVDDRVDFEVVDDVKVGDVIVIRHGAPAIGTVTEAQSKGRMGRGGKLNVNIDFTKTVSGEKVSLRGVKDVKGGGHQGAMTGAMVGTAIVFWPAAPLFLFMKGKDITVPKGHEFAVYSSGAVSLDMAKIEQAGATVAGASAQQTGASLAVSSLPVGAEIEVDGAFVGSTPSSIPVSVGQHHIVVRKPGFANWDRSIRVNGGTINVVAELSRAGVERRASAR